MSEARAEATPGPWTVDLRGNETHVVAGDRPVAQTMAGHRRWYEPTGEDDANARLIAAAPEMLEALSGLIPLVEMDPEASNPTTDLWAALHMAREAVRKATGGQS